MKKFPARFRFLHTRAIAAALLILTPHIACAGGEPPAAPPREETPMQLPVPYTARYSVITRGMQAAEAVYSLTRAGQDWEFRAQARPVKMAALLFDTEISEYSLLEFNGAAVRPLRYRYEQAADDKQDKLLYAEYNWQASTVTVSNGEESRKIAIEAGAHDPLSAQLALIQCVKNDCGEMTYSVIDGMKLQERRFERAGVETVHTALGDYAAVRVSYRRGKRETVTWLAPELNYIPVGIRQLRNNEVKTEMRIIAADFK